MTTSQPAQALVIVPFASCEAANEWASQVSLDYPAEPPLLVTAGAETVVLDPMSGEARHELTFAGGWRAKVADMTNGVVVIARPTATDADLASHSGRP